MKTITLSGAGRGCGKTTVGTFIVEQFSDVAAVKVTPKHKTSPGGDESLLAPEESTADAPSAAQVVVTDPEVLLARGSDTRRYWDVGADPVAWLRARDEGVLEGVEEIRGLRPERPSLIVIESSRYLTTGGHADVALFVYPNGERTLTPTAWQAIEHADAMVVTKRRPGPIQIPIFDDERYPQGKLDIPVFAFNLDEENLSLDDRYALSKWVMKKLDLQTETVNVSGGPGIN